MVAEPYTDDDPKTRLALFHFAFENAPIGIVLVDLEGRIIRGNAAFAKLYRFLWGRCSGRISWTSPIQKISKRT